MRQIGFDENGRNDKVDKETLSFLDDDCFSLQTLISPKKIHFESVFEGVF